MRLPNRGISTRNARKLRAHVLMIRRMKANLIALKLHNARAEVERLRHQLSPEYRLRMQKGLAYWEAAVDSLEDDGVMPDPKGQE